MKYKCNKCGQVINTHSDIEHITCTLQYPHRTSGICGGIYVKVGNIEEYERKAYFTLLKEYCTFSKANDFVEVTEWYNGEGIDVTIDTKNNKETISMTWGQLEALKDIIEHINE